MPMVSTWKITGAALLIFATGVFTGGLTVGLASRASRLRPRSPAGVVDGRAPASASGAALAQRPPGWARLEVLRRMSDELTLSPAQRDRVEARLRESEQRLRRHWEPVAGRVQEELRQLRQDLQRELGPEQGRRLDELLKRRSEKASSSGRP